MAITFTADDFKSTEQKKPITFTADDFMDTSKNNTPQGESGEDWLSKSFPKTARNNLSKLYQGGANSPALVKARNDVSKEESKNLNIDEKEGAVRGAYNMTWPVSAAMNKFGEAPEPTTGGSKMLADMGIIANPLFGLAVGVGEKALGTVIKSSPAIAKTISNIPSKIKQSFAAGKELKDIKSELSGQPIQKFNMGQEIKELTKTKTQTIEQMTDNFKNNNNSLKIALNNESNLQSAANKSIIKNVSSNMSKTYREGLNQAEDELAKKGTVITPSDYNDNVIENTLNELRMKGFPEDNPAFNKIQSLKKQLLEQYPSNEMSLSDLKNMKNSVYDTISSGVKTGSKWADADDQVAMTFLKNHGKYLEKLSPELAQLNKEFAPMANARQWAAKTFRPYSTAEIQRGSSVLERLANKQFPNQTDLNFIKQLESGSGRFTGTGESLQGKTMEIGKNIKDSKTSFDLAKKNLIDSTDYRINRIQGQMAKLQERGINLKYKEQELKNLVGLRNKILGLIAVSATLGTGAVLRRGVHQL